MRRVRRPVGPDGQDRRTGGVLGSRGIVGVIHFGEQVIRSWRCISLFVERMRDIMSVHEADYDDVLYKVIEDKDSDVFVGLLQTGMPTFFVSAERTTTVLGKYRYTQELRLDELLS